MLVVCKECGHEISSKAIFCPSCGYPVKKTPIVRGRPRLPNGFGSITKINRPLRRPYLARISTSKKDNGQCVLKSIGYFKTYNDAYAALIEYKQDYYDLEADMTFSEAYEAFKRDVFSKEDHSKSYTKAIDRSYKYSSALHKMPIRTVRVRHLKSCLESVSSTWAKYDMKNFWNRLFDYCLSYELVNRNYAREFSLDPETVKSITNKKRTHLAFTDGEMRALWSNRKEVTVRAILVQCYMGWRPDELCNLPLSDVDLDNWCVVGGNKTEAGRGRVVPVHTAVRSLVEGMYNEAVTAGWNTLMGINYQQYYYAFKKKVKKLGLNVKHTPHDPRKQFTTMALKAGADPMAVKKLVGHVIHDVTEEAYTERDLEWLRADIEKIDASQYTSSIQTSAD